MNIELFEEEEDMDFEPTFYYQNLTNGYAINKKAIDNLKSMYEMDQLKKIDNYDEIGIVEYVAENDFYIKDNHIYIGYEEDLENV